VNEFVVGAGFYNIAVRPIGIATRQVGLVVRCGEDDGRDRSKAGIGTESNQKITAISSAEFEIQEDQVGERVAVHTVFQEMQRGIRVVLGIEDDTEGGLEQRQAKEFALAGAVFDQEDGGVRYHNN
jgi:hypothetical protein